MYLGRFKLRSILFVTCMVGYAWIYLNYTPHEGSSEESFCFVKQLTSIPCPSCGTTRSVESILHGDISEAFFWNPLGFIMFLILLIMPFWILFDYLGRKDTLGLFYRSAEKFLQQKKHAIPGIALLLANWVWNISKGL